MSGDGSLATIGRILIPTGIGMVVLGVVLWLALDEGAVLIVAALGLSDLATGAFLIGQAERRGERPADEGLTGPAPREGREADVDYNPYAHED